jgi:hypothetical protein
MWTLKIEYQTVFMRVNGMKPETREFSGTEIEMRTQMARVKVQIMVDSLKDGAEVSTTAGSEYLPEGMLRTAYEMMRTARRQYLLDLPTNDTRQRPATMVREAANAKYANARRAVFSALFSDSWQEIDANYGKYFNGHSVAKFTLTSPSNATTVTN